MEAVKRLTNVTKLPELTVYDGGASVLNSSRQDARINLKRASGLVEAVAYDLAGQETPEFISRLIEIAAELDRHGSQ